MNTIVSKELYLHNAIENCEILYNKNWGQLQHLEAFYVKPSSSEINVGLKVFKKRTEFF